MWRRFETEKLVVFISGTMRGLPKERARVAATIQEMGLEPVWAEKRGATDRPSRDECERIVRTCDVYLGLYGLSYGWKFPPRETISATEFEWQVAKDAGKPMLIYRQKGRPDPEQVAFLKKVGDWQEGRFWYEFETLDDLLPRLRDDLARLIAERFRPGTKLSVDLWLLRNFEQRLQWLANAFSHCEQECERGRLGGELAPEKYDDVAKAWKDSREAYSEAKWLASRIPLRTHRELFEELDEAHRRFDEAIRDKALRRIPERVQNFETALKDLQTEVSNELTLLISESLR